MYDSHRLIDTLREQMFHIYIYIYIYIQGGIWHYVDRKNFYMGIMGTRRLR